MSPHHIKLVETTIQFLQFVTSIFIIVLSATGAAFYYYWTTRPNNIQIGNLYPFAFPAGITLFAFLTIGYIYALQADSFATGIIVDNTFWWINWCGLILGLFVCANIAALVWAFVAVHGIVTDSSSESETGTQE